MTRGGPGQGLPISLHVGSVNHPGAGKGHGPSWGCGHGGATQQGSPLPAAWLPPQTDSPLAGWVLGVLVPATCWVPRACPVLVSQRISLGCSHAVPWGPPRCPVCWGLHVKGWVPGSAPCSQSWVEGLPWMAAVAVPKAELMVLVSCKRKEWRGAGELLHPCCPPSCLELGTSRRDRERNAGM